MRADGRTERRAGRIEGRTDRWTDRGTDTTKLIIAFCNFANAPKKERKEPKKKRTKKVRTNGQENSRRILVALIFRPQIKTKRPLVLVLINLM